MKTVLFILVSVSLILAVDPKGGDGLIDEIILTNKINNTEQIDTCKKGIEIKRIKKDSSVKMINGNKDSCFVSKKRR